MMSIAESENVSTLATNAANVSHYCPYSSLATNGANVSQYCPYSLEFFQHCTDRRPFFRGFAKHTSDQMYKFGNMTPSKLF